MSGRHLVRLYEGYESATLDRLYQRSRFSPASGCWEWTGSRRSRNGYGRISYRNSERQAHRVMYELLVAPIPVGMVLDHVCRNRCCINPNHLEPVTPRENTLRGMGPTGRRRADVD